MCAVSPCDDVTARPSRIIAEALIERQEPQQIAARAASLGLSPQLTHLILVACGATDIDVALFSPDCSTPGC